MIGPQPSAPIRSGHLDKRPTVKEEMAAEQRLRKYFHICVCDEVYGYFYAYLLLRPFLFLIVSRLRFIHVPAVPTCIAFPRLSSAAGSVCVCLSSTFFSSCFLFNQSASASPSFLIWNTRMRSHRTLCSNSHDSHFFCANTHNLYGLICCSFPPRLCFPPPLNQWA